MQDKDYYDNSYRHFVGVVEQVLSESHVKVRCFGIHPMDRTKVRTDQLPSALVIYPTSGGQVNGGTLSHNIQVDSWVTGFFTDYPFCMNLFVDGVINGSDYSMSTYKYQGGEFVGQGTSGSGSNTGSGNPDAGIDPNGSINIPGDSNTQKAYNYVYAKLISEKSSSDPHLHTSALIGVLKLETSGINPSVTNSIGAYGICQWLGSRRETLLKRYGGKTNRLDHQLDFMWWELNYIPVEKRAKSLWLRSTNMPDAVAGFCMFERAEEVINGRVIRTHKNFKLRLNYAYQIYNSMKYTASEEPNITKTNDELVDEIAAAANMSVK